MGHVEGAEKVGVVVDPVQRGWRAGWMGSC